MGYRDGSRLIEMIRDYVCRPHMPLEVCGFQQCSVTSQTERCHISPGMLLVRNPVAS